MKYTISREQHFFFEQHHYIEFEGLLSQEEQKLLSQLLQNKYKSLRDLSHASAEMKAITHTVRLAKLVSDLTHIRSVRFGFDELLTVPYHLSNLHNELCIKGLVGALYLSIDPEESKGIFALPTMDLASLPLNREKPCFVIGYAEKRAQYLLQPKDRYTHELKRRGYVFGDRLKEEWHPTLTR